MLLRVVEAGQPTDIVLSNSVVSFDGRVLELFGHASRTGNRIHVGMITGVSNEGDKIVISTRGAVDYSIVLSDVDAAARDQLDNLVERVRRAASNIQR